MYDYTCIPCIDRCIRHQHRLSLQYSKKKIVGKKRRCTTFTLLVFVCNVSHEDCRSHSQNFDVGTTDLIRIVLKNPPRTMINCKPYTYGMLLSCKVCGYLWYIPPTRNMTRVHYDGYHAGLVGTAGTTDLKRKHNLGQSFTRYTFPVYPCIVYIVSSQNVI